MKWAERVTGISSMPKEGVSTGAQEDTATPTTTTAHEVCSMGWALKTTSKRPRIGDNVKRYLIEKFNTGERSGSKVDPLSVSREMKVKKGENGKLLFQPDEWKSVQTIKSFFSRYRAKLKQQQIEGLHSGVEDIEELPEEDEEAVESEVNLQDVRLAVYNDLEKPEHPIEVNGRNLCDLVLRNKLNTLKMDELKTICGTIGLTIQGHKNRKNTYIMPMQELIRNCSCST